MGESGLKLVDNPSQLFLLEQPESTPGSVVTVVMEGKMPFLVEIQALTSKTAFGYPVRKSVGFDSNRLQMIIAVLSKKCNVKLDTQDVYVNVVGGLKIDEPAIDLAVAVAIISSLKEVVISQKTVVLGEVGLAGEIRSISQIDNRLNEASRLGFIRAVTGKAKLDEKKFKLKITQLGNLSEVVMLLEKKVG
jgi:DNA repair protein RadA/Sms